MYDISKWLRFSLTAAAACVAATLVHDAKALGPVDVEGGLHLGYGSDFLAASGTRANPFGFGLGGKAGVTLLKSFYAGANFTYYFGEEKQIVASKARSNGHTVGLDVGYHIDLTLLQIRPYLEAGLYTARQSGDVPSVENGSFYLAPSAMAKIPLGLFYVGADFRFGTYFEQQSTVMTATGTSTSSGKSVQTNLNFFAMLGINI